MGATVPPTPPASSAKNCPSGPTSAALATSPAPTVPTPPASSVAPAFNGVSAKN